MKGILRLLRRPARSDKSPKDPSDSVFFSTAFSEQNAGAAALIPWEARAVEVGAKRLSASRGGKLLQALWAKDKYMATIAVDRIQPWGEQLRLAETRPGDILGEMSLLDSGIRFSACTTLNDCDIAVLSADATDEMMVRDPQLAASLVALLSRKLSMRLRAVSARLSENQN